MSKKTIRVYSTPNCQQCRATYRWLDQRGIEYTKEDATEVGNNEAIKALGYKIAPVVIVSSGDPETDLHWGGFNPDLLAKYCAAEVVS